MSYKCHYCEQETENARSIPMYDSSGQDDRWEILCEDCHAEWLHSLKG